MRHVSDSQLRKDGNGSWGKPSGCSRYYKVDAVTNDAIRVDRGHQMPNEHEYDIQVGVLLSIVQCFSPPGL
jgi:hypothetical protein